MSSSEEVGSDIYGWKSEFVEAGCARAEATRVARREALLDEFEHIENGKSPSSTGTSRYDPWGKKKD